MESKSSELSNLDQKKMDTIKADIRFAKEHGYEKRRGVWGHTRPLVKRLYVSTQTKPVLGRASRMTAGVILASRTQDRVSSLERRIASLERRLKKLEQERD